MMLTRMADATVAAAAPVSPPLMVPMPMARLVRQRTEMTAVIGVTTLAAVTSAAVIRDDGDNDDCWSSNPLLDAASKPLRVLFACTIPDPETHPDWYPLTFLLSLFYVAVQSELCCFLAEDICAILRVPHEYAGVTLLALGAQVPDTITSISMARGGMYDGAITSAIGSQVLNITLGIGVPFALFSWLNDAPIVATLGNIRSVSICLFVSIALYLVSCIKCCASGNRSGAHVSACGAFIMLVGFIGCNWYMASTMLQGWSL